MCMYRRSDDHFLCDTIGVQFPFCGRGRYANLRPYRSILQRLFTASTVRHHRLPPPSALLQAGSLASLAPHYTSALCTDSLCARARSKFHSGFTMFTSIHVNDVIVITSCIRDSRVVCNLKGVACETQHSMHGTSKHKAKTSLVSY